MKDDTRPDLVELLRHFAKLATDTVHYERDAVISGRLAAVERLASDAAAEPLAKKRPATKAERKALAATLRAYRYAESARRALGTLHDGEPPSVDVLELAEDYIMLSAYQAGYAQAMADQSDARKHSSRTRSESTKRVVQSVAEEVEQAAKAAGSAAGLAEKLAPRLNRSTGYLERRIRAVRRRLESGHE